MSALSQDSIVELVVEGLREAGLQPPRVIRLTRIPFSGGWGWATPVCFQLASLERKSDPSLDVGLRSQQMAEALRDALSDMGDFSKVEAAKGYVNLYFEAGRVANELLSIVLERGEDFGRGASKGERVMIEYSQPNTHKAFHVGHLRNVCLGHALCRVMDFAGFDAVPANYPGDIGMHVIKCLWCYLSFHREQTPPENRGRWLGEIYAQADALLTEANRYRSEVVACLQQALASRGSLGARMRDWFQGECLKASAARGDDVEWQGDIRTLSERLRQEEPFEINDIVHRPVGDWLWNLWLAFGRELTLLRAEVAKEASSEDADAIRQCAQRNESIGADPEKWFYAKEMRRLLRRWEARDPEIVDLWRETRQWSLDDFQRIYAQLGAEFEAWFFESEAEESGKEIAEELVEKGIATDLRPNGAVIVEIDKRLGLDTDEYRTLVILRSDGSSLYSTKDLSLAKRKFEEYGVDRSIYVVDVGQSLYFRQIFKVLELWGFEQARKCFHLAYEVVRLPSGKMSSRSGSVVFYDDFYQEALDRARRGVDEKRGLEHHSEVPDLDQVQRGEVARAVALGAMKYGMLCVDNNKPITFDLDSALSFEGQTAPYIQYAHARACRILEKAGAAEGTDFDYAAIAIETAEIDLLETIAAFPHEVERAAGEFKPLYIAVYLYKLAKTFSDFYRDCPVLKGEEAVRRSRLALVDAARQTLANGLRLLAIPAPRVM